MSIKFTILGCGSSLGIPRIDGYYGSCDPKNKRNIRSRCSALISSKNLNILIYTSPDLKSQLLKNKVKNIDTVFYTHLHADQTHGINELRVFSLKNRKKIPIFADEITKKYLKILSWVQSIPLKIMVMNMKLLMHPVVLKFPI